MRIVILIASLLLMGAGVVLSYLDKTSGATATYAASIFCLIFVYLSQFKRFKGFGVEAELLEKKIEEADEALKRLRAITAPIAHMLFTMVARMGRWDSMVPRKQRYEIMEQIENELLKNGVEEDVLEESKKDWHHFNIIDLARPIINGTLTSFDEIIKAKQEKVNSFRGTITAEIKPEHDLAISELRKVQGVRQELADLYKLKNKKRLATEIEKFIVSNEILEKSRKDELLNKYQEELEDLKHYIKYKEFRRLEHWFVSKD